MSSTILRPSHLLDPLWRLLLQAPGGIVQLCGAAGTGKSVTVQALEREARGKSLACVVCPLSDRGLITFLRTFLTPELRSSGVRSVLGQVAYRASSERGFETRAAQVAAGLAEQPSPILKGFLKGLMEANDLERLVVVLEDLDVFCRNLGISRACAEAMVAEELPPGCFLLLTLEAPWLAGPRVHSFSLDGMEHRRFMTRLVSRRLPGTRHIDQFLAASQGKALYLELLMRGLEHGLLAAGDLPVGSAIVPALLESLRLKVGTSAYRQIHLPALHLLAAARQRVSPALLRRWGISEEGLHLALFDLRHVLDGLRLDSATHLLHAPPLTLMHPRLHEDVVGHGPWRLPARWAEQQIVKARASSGSPDSPVWYEICVEVFERELGGLGERAPGACRALPAVLREEAELYLYNLLFALSHLDRTGQEPTRMREDPAYAKELWRLGIRSFRTSPLSAGYLLGASCTLFEAMGNQEEELAGRLLDWSAVLSNLEWFAESAKSSRTSCGVFCHLLERGSHGVKGSLARSLKNLGVSLRALQKPQEADLAYRAAARLLRELGRTGELATLLINRGNALWDIEQREEAMECLRESLALLRTQEPMDELEIATVLELMADRLEETEALKSALECCEEALALSRHLPQETARCRLLQLRRGCLLARLQQADNPRPDERCEAERAFEEALEPAEDSAFLEPDDLAHAARCLRDLGSELSLRYYERAVAAYTELVGQGRSRLRRELAECLLEMGRLKQEQGRGWRASMAQARRLLGQLVAEGHADLEQDLLDCEASLERGV